MKINNNLISVVILAGGMGSRFSSVNEPPKQLSKLNKDLIIIHIINNFKKFGFKHFIFPLGAKQKFFFKFFNSKKINLNINLIFLKRILITKILSLIGLIFHYLMLEKKLAS